MRTKYLGKGRITVTLSEKDLLDLKLNRRTFNWFVERARLEQKTRTERKAKILSKSRCRAYAPVPIPSQHRSPYEPRLITEK
jgi:hypothetical protein